MFSSKPSIPHYCRAHVSIVFSSCSSVLSPLSVVFIGICVMREKVKRMETMVHPVAITTVSNDNIGNMIDGCTSGTYRGVVKGPKNPVHHARE